MLKYLFRLSNRLGVEIQHIPTPLQDAATVSSIVAVYRQVFADAPWHEAYMCPLCKSSYGKNYLKKVCDACLQDGHHILLVEHWPTYKVIRDFYKEMVKPHAVCVVARSEEGLVGFAWGYRMELDAEASSHLDAPQIHESLHGSYFYIDEVALLLPYRGKGIGKNLVQAIIRGQEQGRVLLRTLHQSPMENLVHGVGGTIVQHISDDRVIMVM